MSGGNWKDMFKGIQQGDYNLVEYYLNVGIDPNYQHPEYMAAPIVESIRFNHLDITQLLLDNGADPLAVEYMEGVTALSYAKEKKNQAAITLIEKYLSKK